MCFFSKQTKTAVELENRFNAKIENGQIFRANPYINGFSFPKTPIIANNKISMIQHYQWGLIPSWAKDDSIKKFTLNAKIETLKEKPSFRNSINNRCLVIADGYYEWQWLDSKGKKKQQYLITLPNGELFAFAGIWSEWVNKETGEIIKSYSIITTEANQLMREIHNSKKRMPVILTKNNENDWLTDKPVEDFKKVDIELKAMEN